MKRIKIFILTLILALTLMGAGYAAWQQDLTVSNDVNTGELKVVVNDITNDIKLQEVTIQKRNASTYWSVSGDSIGQIMNDGSKTFSYGNYMNVILKTGNNQKSILFQMNNAFPGIKVKYYVKLTNKGTVPVRLNLVDGYNDGNLAKISGMNEETKALIDAGLLQANISPNFSDESGSDPSGLTLGVGNYASYSIEILVSPNLTEVENTNLVCELKFNFTQNTN